MHNQQNHNHQEHHHAEGGCGCNHSHSKTQHGCSSEPKNAAAQAEHAHHHHDHGDSGCCTAAPDDPDEESDRLAAAPLPVANVSAGKSPVWTAPAAPRKSKMPSPHSPASTARACCSPPRNWWSTRSPTSACGSRRGRPSRLYPARHSDRQSRRAENLTLRRIRTAAAVSHPDGRQLGAGSG